MCGLVFRIPYLFFLDDSSIDEPRKLDSDQRVTCNQDKYMLIYRSGTAEDTKHIT